MAFTTSKVPPTVVAKMAKSEEGDMGDEPKKQSREEFKKMKELEEMRKAGTAPAMKDEEGRDINPHIPQYIMDAPWYFGTLHPTLSHQRVQEEQKKIFSKMGNWYNKGIKTGEMATKYRKGACENCGAVTHKKKDCLERPRKIGAKFTGEDIAPDEHLQPDLDFDYDGKRDRWNGFDTTDYNQKVSKEYAKLEEAKRIIKEQELEAKLKDGDTEALKKTAEESEDEDEDKYADDVSMPGQKFETKQRITVRNLRIREDTAKYLHNLDTNSAYYDPKTRSMRENPFQNTGQKLSELPYAGDNFVRFSGDASGLAKQQMFAWQSYEKGVDINLQADPTKLELLKREYTDKESEFKSKQKDSILDKYGGEEHLESLPKQLLMAQSEEYVEYSRHGKVIKGQEKAIIKSRYEEDVLINNHSSVWGSYWKAGVWGFKCCHSTVKESYCVGEAGKRIAAESDSIGLMKQVARQEQTEEPQKSLVQLHQEKTASKNKKKKKKQKLKRRKRKKESSSSSDSSSSDEEKDEEVKKRKLVEAVKKQEEHDKQVQKLMSVDERKRPYNSMVEVREPTEEDMEAYRLKRKNMDDPMAKFLS